MQGPCRERINGSICDFTRMQKYVRLPIILILCTVRSPLLIMASSLCASLKPLMPRRWHAKESQHFASAHCRVMGEVLELSIEQQVELLSSKSATEPASPLHKFVEITRRETIRGYYTS